jgi:2'-5' RNA ligase
VPYLSPASDAPAPNQTAVIAAVPVADALVERHRQHLDAAAAWGVPAHVTVLYPFVEPARVDDDLVATLATAARCVASFECRFERTRWFGDDVLWLDPNPAEPFRRLTAAVGAAFPECPPYGGAFDEVVPHLTVAERRFADLATLKGVERDVLAGLPLVCPIERVLLIAGTQAPNSWTILSELRLGAST